MKIRVPEWFQGPTGSGQGGWTSGKVVELVGQPSTVAIRAPIPLETDLDIVELDTVELDTVEGERRHAVLDRSADEPVTILEATSWDPVFPETNAIGLDHAIAAQSNFGWTLDDHPVPHCFSCGLQPDSMGVHVGVMPDGRYASPWTPPTWAESDSDLHAATWAALDCTAATFACTDGGARTAFTVQLAVEIIEPIDRSETYALVAWPGDGAPGWDGRKRTAASAAFDSTGRCVARSTSFWVSVADS